MTAPTAAAATSAAAAARRLVLVPTAPRAASPSAAASADAGVRRYRLARRRVETHGGDRFAHLKRSYD